VPSISPRAINDASFASTPDQFAHLSTAVSYISDQQVQTTYRVSILESKERAKACENLEEKEGRINSDLLNHFVLIGAPFVPAGPDMQAQLVSQVLNISLISLLLLA
jgi:hypothetical protein